MMEKDFKEMLELANSPAGQQLLRMVQQNNSPQMKSAMDKAAAGDYAEAKQLIQAILSKPEAAALVEQLRRR